MQYRLMDILADPDNPEIWPLKLKVFKSEKRERNNKPGPHESTGLLCKFYCYKFDSMLVNDPLSENEKTKEKAEINKITNYNTCLKCIEEEVIDGVIFHNQNDKLKFFVVDREIPVMYPLELRDKEIEGNFINRNTVDCEKMNISKPYEI